MADSYAAISEIANDHWMVERITACAFQQSQLGLQFNNVLEWVSVNRYVWASSPSWGEKWDYALAAHPDESDYEPGKDSAVITDDDILSTVQYLVAPPSSE